MEGVQYKWTLNDTGWRNCWKIWRRMNRTRNERSASGWNNLQVMSN